MAEKQREKIYECEVKRKRRPANGIGYEAFWKLKSVQEALDDNDTEFRCKDCHGSLKLNRRKTIAGSGSFVEHVHKPDSEYCLTGMHFQKAADGREPRLSENPVR